ncbi:flagellar hook-length control protein FliK [Pantoea ananatis]|uniref:flagellar hook-length control protein FliK n=1 Tax=Pantoea ananas TaxID=553 RepID=UPI000DA6A173|nr:flagellar hook-length control protein FliK [Pantoea ananatis]MCW0307072.1 Flagellar hook-length control protein [Pantoea ananatis]MCW0311023.1 Flagellar hook-length control protein [Pantoea ananatis]MCW0338512.1 Flagellar hook-length control protein [Pantoea ananatis]MCW0355785.1 Flagellar hook-length control protein [Pantoea ananatis]MCW0361073.1 Flagellar hook-length control protein [Pantoea ananatis]
MITLPNTALTTKAIGTADTSGATDLLSSGETLPQDFITALGNQLLSLAKLHGKTPAATDKNVTAETEHKTATSLNALLSSLETPTALSALFTPEKIKAGTKSADDKDELTATALNNTDIQNIQALFAMLPAAGMQQAVKDNAANRGADLQGDAPRSALSALTQAVTTALTSDGKESQNTKVQDGNLANKASLVSQSVTGPTAATSHNTAVTPAALTTDGSFQQILSSVSKQDDRPLAAASDNQAILSAPVSSTSSVLQSSGASATMNSPSTPTLNAHLGSNEWQQALGQQIVMFSRNGQQNAELRLHPEDLGAIQISLKLNNDQAQLNMVSSNSHVRAALEAALPQLRHALAESGINLGESQVSSESFSQGQSFQQQQEARRDGQHGSFSLTQDSDNDMTPIAVPQSLQARLTGKGAVDTFA